MLINLESFLYAYSTCDQSLNFIYSPDKWFNVAYFSHCYLFFLSFHLYFHWICNTFCFLFKAVSYCAKQSWIYRALHITQWQAAHFKRLIINISLFAASIRFFRGNCINYEDAFSTKLFFMFEDLVDCFFIAGIW